MYSKLSAFPITCQHLLKQVYVMSGTQNPVHHSILLKITIDMPSVRILHEGPIKQSPVCQHFIILSEFSPI